MEYNFSEIEKRWQGEWTRTGAYAVTNDSTKPKCYVLDMFPYPSGAGLHVGHPLGYIASDIYARYKRLKGFHVLHPMGYDAFGLPAEQYALEHGVHPADSTAKNIATFRTQLDKIGFSYDWSREVNTSKPEYYRWTQWIFLQLFNSWYNPAAGRTEPIESLEALFEAEGNVALSIPSASMHTPGEGYAQFTAADWKAFSEKEQQNILMAYRVAYCGYGEVNWCDALGTVLANDEVINGVSERGGYPVVKKKLRQWYLRITAYADRLIERLNTVEFSEAMKEMQRNWIGKSVGAEVMFAVESTGSSIDVYTTRPDTLFGVDFLVLAPEHRLVLQLTTPDQKANVEAYVAGVQSRSERERMAEKTLNGVFTGAYARHPLSGKPIPVWISEYVLAGYGTGAIMGVPAGDDRDHRFAQHFGIPITNIFGDAYTGEGAVTDKVAMLHNSDFLNGKTFEEALPLVLEKLETNGSGQRKVVYKIRDAAFSRQRYWGEPFPIVWKDGVAYPLDEGELPLELPHVDSYSAGPEGEGPLANIEAWTDRGLETNTMPGYAGSSWYFLRYMDPGNATTFADRKISDYWNAVDLYVGGTEHAVGHLLYSRMWTKALYDLGHIGFDEPFKRLLNQGMIQGSSRFVFRVRGTNTFVSEGLKASYETDPLYVDVNIVDGVELDTEAFKAWRPEYRNAEFILEDGKYICGTQVEKMSKRLFNTVNPDTLVDRYGADTFRMYEMFLGPVEMSKPWDTKGIEGVHRFLKKFWRLFYSPSGDWLPGDAAPTPAELKILHRTIKRIESDTERFAFNTCVSAFMVCVNELTEMGSHKKSLLQPLLTLLSPFAPHIAAELWERTGGEGSVLDSAYPQWDAAHLEESEKEYPVSINGKLRTQLLLPMDASAAEAEAAALALPTVQKWMEDKPLKKFVFVPGRMINVVV